MSIDTKRGLRHIAHNPAAIIIDMQKDFLKSVPEAQKLVHSQGKVISYCRQNNIPVAAVEYVYHGKTINPLRELIKKVPRHNFIAKRQADAFSNPELDEILASWNPDKLLFMGLNATLCVLDAAQSALERGYGVVTAYQLIDDEAYFKKRKKSLKWYKKNALYFPDYRSLLKE
ncbi:cysteine hydrolase [Candidatus Woesearchaeota archaeon]|nr:cysteine hydrolase [Candidatus Woesearchaeota archaeon]